MRPLFLLLAPVLIFGVSVTGRWFANFAVDNAEEWWGGFPLWITGATSVFAPVLIGGLFEIANLAFG